jgi:hypothetical protein
MTGTARLTRFSLTAGGLAWMTYAGLTWLRYGRSAGAPGPDPDPLEAFIPDPEVEEEHQTRVAAPASVALRASKALEIQRSPLVHLIFTLRGLPARIRGGGAQWQSAGLVEEALGIGWGVLADQPDELFIAGAVTRPWEAEVTFHALAPDEFAAFDEPGCAKIVWSLETQPLSEQESILRTRTRVKTTDPFARRRFRRYWALLSPGILLIRHEALRLVRQDARRSNAPEPVVAPVISRART